MNKFVAAAVSTPTLSRTQNNMKAFADTASATVDLFYNIGASRGKDITPMFRRAFATDEDLALRIALWARDVRGGAGEREVFRDVLRWLEKHEPEVLLNTKILEKVPELGRWDDLLVFNYNPEVKSKAFDLIAQGLRDGNGLCAKWMPRKGVEAVELRNALGMTPKQYRKTLVNLSHTVEQAMCAKEYERINYAHVPSLAMSRYMKAFSKNDKDRFVAYRESLIKGETKINASAVYPYDVIKTIRFGGDDKVANEQWKALPDYMDDTNVLPMVDVSGSMCCPAGGNPNVQCIDVSLSLGLYCASKNKGAFKDMFLTFSAEPQIQKVSGTLKQRLVQMDSSEWGMNTDIIKAFKHILKLATTNDVPESDMPSVVLILSDMQFDQCAQFDDSAMESIKRQYATAGYKVPTVVFWNLNASYGNAPVSFSEKGVALVSGFSPAIMKAVLAADFDTLSPESIVRDAVCVPRYDYK
jgi:hypothetical protein